jgi:calpain-15
MGKIQALTTCEKIIFVATFPFVCVALPICKFLLPCISLICHQIVVGGCFKLFREVLGCGEDCGRFSDTAFCGEDALGNGDDVEWKRVSEIGHDKSSTVHLFGSIIDATDIAQGELGDCWLLSAFACLAEFPGAVQNVFVTREHSFRGKYTVKLWSTYANRWTKITIDDKIPCKKRGGVYQPIYCQSADMEGQGHHQKHTAWSMLLEKAFAKYCGSYQVASSTIYVQMKCACSECVSVCLFVCM